MEEHLAIQQVSSCPQSNIAEGVLSITDIAQPLN